jgi:aminopeptidase N
MKTETHKPTLLADYAPPPFLIETVHLDVSLHPTETRVRSRLRMRRNPKAPVAKSLELDGEHLRLVSIALDGKALHAGDHHVGSASLLIHRVPDKAFTLEIETTCDPSGNTALNGLYRSRGVYTTQCEAQGFRRITYFLDRPDVMAVFTTRIEADVAEAGTLLGNGNPTERGTLKGGQRHYAVWHDPHPKPSYLFALVGGNLVSTASTFETRSGRRVDLAIHVEPGKQNRCGWAMDALKRAMRWDEDAFGREYDLDVFNIVAVSDFNMGAMENKGLNIFNDRLILATPETATDQNFADIERVIAHEYFHNWTGNRITCRDWFQLCLKEGLTVYRDQEFSADMRSRAVQRIADVRMLKARQFPEDQGPLAHPVRPERYIEINNFYTSTVYEKGAELVRMIATLIGDDAFRRGMDLYFERHDNSAATVEEFIDCFATVSGRDLTAFMMWYRQAGTPDLTTTFVHDPATRTATLTLEQRTAPTPGQPVTVPLHMPVRVGFLDGKGREIAPAKLGLNESGVLELTKARQDFRFTGLKERPVPSILRGFSAPVTLHMDLPDADLAFLMAHDTDTFNRWQAGQTYALRLLATTVDDVRAGRRSKVPQAYIDALAPILTDRRLDAATRALMITLPAHIDVARHIGANIDPAAIQAALLRFGKSIATALAEPLLQTYTSSAPRGRFSPDAAAAGKRALRNRALALLFTRCTADDVGAAIAHFETASNATDETFALALLMTSKARARRTALDRFYARWSGDHLMINHWFMAQAIAPFEETLETVRDLTDHPLFSLTNPNKVSAVIGAFANSNPVAFHRADGAGYEFVADRVLALDPINPQMAARLLGAFKTWRMLEPKRAEGARKALQALVRVRGLSRDVHEIATRMLD